jgi:hypothetical protein
MTFGMQSKQAEINFCMPIHTSNSAVEKSVAKIDFHVLHAFRVAERHSDYRTNAAIIEQIIEHSTCEHTRHTLVNLIQLSASSTTRRAAAGHQTQYHIGGRLTMDQLAERGMKQRRRVEYLRTGWKKRTKGSIERKKIKTRGCTTKLEGLNSLHA